MEKIEEIKALIDLIEEKFKELNFTNPSVLSAYDKLSEAKKLLNSNDLKSTTQLIQEALDFIESYDSSFDDEDQSNPGDPTQIDPKENQLELDKSQLILGILVFLGFAILIYLFFIKK